MPQKTIRIAQTGSVLANFDDNIDHHCTITEDAIRAGADAVAFPELSLSGYNVQDAAQDIAMHIEDKKLDPLRALSEKICIICGGIELSDDYGVYNSAFMFEDGKGKSIHRKLYLPTYGMFEELRYFSAGQHVRAVNSRRLGRIGVAICEDFWHVSVPYLLAHQGAKMLFALMSSPLRMTPGSGTPEIVTQWQTIAGTYAFLFSAYVACVNRTGNEDSFTYWGNSSLTGPDGRLIAAAPLFREQMLDVTADFCEVKRTRLRSSHFLDEDIRLFASELRHIINATRPSS
ncbi:MAG: acyltransferase [Chlorobium sp.]|uniref:nitrilase-related carbon-nitrogen hydrolase n=1 Tax=Chlorobium sp. TaxID=1095 RepID=UPI0025BD9D63|nr:nitrilase-related carbon-nitrogen hydrolase [Chlorobium sp.]MCF8215635.1 acyltransferase [Chlorobium sp.]MCF8270690.1 acyltransferase [Chlorobium sp.]MCF8286844.1 acyltransferase [Chlorobium sp.]MCF8290580.1 acyltransferase [Chlorobium sp.]MCF8384536.1 acyltransferase [Chlorobium sp.]